MKEYKDKLQHHYGSIFEEILLQEIAAVSKYKGLAGEASIINLGDTIQYMPLLLDTQESESATAVDMRSAQVRPIHWRKEENIMCTGALFPLE